MLKASDNSNPAENFAVSSKQLQLFHSDKDIYLVKALGGVKGLESKLDTSTTDGLLYVVPGSSAHTSDNGNSSSHHGHNERTTINTQSDVSYGTLNKSSSNSNGNGSAGNGSDDTSNAIQVDNPNNHPSYEKRQEYFGTNRLPEKKSKNFFELVWIALQDKVLILLSVVAVVSLAIGLYQTFGQPPEYDEDGNPKPRVEWVEGVAIIVAIAIVSLVGAANDWQKERQFVKLNKKKEDRRVKVIRGGHTIEISVFDIVVGDIVKLEPGDVIPCDGLLVNGFSVKTDESSLTGESDTIKKASIAQALEKLENNPNISPKEKGLDCFIISGSKVLEGTGDFIVTAVGVSSFYGKTLASLHTDDEETPLQEKLNIIAEGIAKLGTLAAGIMFVVLLIRFLVKLPNSTLTGPQKGEEFLNIVITSITVIVVAVPEGLPLAVTLALAFATTRMIKDNNLVRVLKACETMGGATTVCSDKTGTLTQNRMTVVAGTLGLDKEFAVETDSSSYQDEPTRYSDRTPQSSSNKKADSPEKFVSSLSSEARELLMTSIVINSSAFESLDYESEIAKGNTAAEHYTGSKTETSSLSFAYDYLDLGNLKEARSKYSVVSVYPFDSAKKYMATVIELPDNGGFRLLIKGAAEVLLKACTSIWDGKKRGITDEDVDQTKSKITEYASNSLRAIGFVYRDFTDAKSWPPSGFDEEKDLLKDVTFFGIIGIKDPLRKGVRKAVADCQHAGVVVRMVTGDNLITAKSIAADCGIYEENQDQIVMEGPEFREKSQKELYKIAPKLRVIARSSPEDKRRLVKILRKMGETVAVTGDGTNDAPALKLADVGFSMGISGTEVAKEASEIILMDDNFGSIVKAIIWGRTVNDAVKKFLQFQLTVNITAVILTFVSAVGSSNNASVLTAVQLLWVNLIMDTFAALALATDPPHSDVLDRKPDNRKASLITPTMWKIILGEALYQLIICFILNFAGNKLFNAHTSKELVQVHSLVFNTFVWMQFFEMFVSRRLDNKLNMFDGILENYYFVGITSIIFCVQILIMFVGGAAFNIERQTPAMWATALLCGFGSIPVGILLRLIPDELVIKLFPTRLWRFLNRMYEKMKFWNKGENEGNQDGGRPRINVSNDEEARLNSSNQYFWPEPLEQVKADLRLLKLRGGRWNLIKTKPKQLYNQMKSTLSSNSSIYEAFVPDSSSSSSNSSQNNGVSQDTDGFLTVPGGNNENGPNRNRQELNRVSSNGKGHSIDALTMVPTIIGGAVAGWGGEANPAYVTESQNKAKQSTQGVGVGGDEDTNLEPQASSTVLVTKRPSSKDSKKKKKKKNHK